MTDLQRELGPGWDAIIRQSKRNRAHAMTMENARREPWEPLLHPWSEIERLEREASQQPSCIAESPKTGH